MEILQAPPANHEEIKIETEDDIVIVRQRVRTLAQEKHFDSFAVAALTTAASELGRNIWAHAGSGIARIEILTHEEKEGIKITFEDHGPGISDIPRVLAGGYSTGKSLGLGLSGTTRLVDDFQIDSQPGKGTTVTVTKWNPIY